MELTFFEFRGRNLVCFGIAYNFDGGGTGKFAPEAGKPRMRTAFFTRVSVVLVEEKFQSLTVNPRNIDAENDDKTLNIDNHDVRKAGQIKLLGVFTDENLNFAGHITELCTRANQKVGMLLRLRILMPCNANLMLPYLTSCHLVWKFYKSSDSRKIERIQERALRAVYKSQTETYEELLTSAKLPTTYNRRLQDTAILMYKVKYGMAPRCVSELFTIKSTHQRLL